MTGPEADAPRGTCGCENATAPYTHFTTREVGRDDTEGRFADVDIEQCVVCGRHWLRYHVEHEAFSRSGRWARGLVSADLAATITPEEAAPYLHSLDWYLYGGSYFGGTSGRRRGPMNWGI